jgi:hypothetical protein
MSVCLFGFSANERVIWNCPNTRSVYAIFRKMELKEDGNEYAIITPLAGIADERWDGENMCILAEQLIPAF